MALGHCEGDDTGASPLMSALGQQRRFDRGADYVRSSSGNGLPQGLWACLKRAKTRLGDYRSEFAPLGNQLVKSWKEDHLGQTVKLIRL